jgi:hypothetical protein
MKIVHVVRASALVGLVAGFAGAGCMTTPDGDPEQAAASSSITLNTSATYSLVGVQSGKCVGIVGVSSASNARLDIETCTFTANQRFHPDPMATGFFRLRNELTGLCMDVSGAVTTNGGAVIQFTCGTQTNQQWSITDVAGGAEVLTARHSGLVLDVTGQGTADGTLLEQFASNGGANQQFVMNQAIPAIAPGPATE